MQKRRLWLGSASTSAAYGVLSSVRRVWGSGVTVIASDELPLEQCTAALEADHYVRLPPPLEGDYRDALRAGVAEHGADVIVSVIDSEVSALAALQDDDALGDGVRALVPSFATAQVCNDKLLLARTLALVGLPSPRTEPFRDAAWDERGMFVKPRHGWGSARVRTFSDQATFEHARGLPGIDLIAQPLLDQPELTVDVFCADGRVRALARERLRVVGGVTTAARVFEDDTLSAIAYRLAGHLGLVGAFCFQVMRDGDAWAITDVNPRCGGATAISAAVGFDPVAAMLAEVWGEDAWAHVPPLVGERHVTRQYREFVMPAASR